MIHLTKIDFASVLFDCMVKRLDVVHDDYVWKILGIELEDGSGKCFNVKVVCVGCVFSTVNRMQGQRETVFVRTKV